MTEFSNLTGSDSEVIREALDLASDQVANFSLIARDGRIATTYARYEVWSHQSNSYNPNYTPNSDTLAYVYGNNPDVVGGPDPDIFIVLENQNGTVDQLAGTIFHETEHFIEEIDEEAYAALDDTSRFGSLSEDDRNFVKHIIGEKFLRDGIKTLAPDADHRSHKCLNNLIERSHRPTRKREKIFGRFKSARQAQRFLTAHDQINTIFRPRRYRLSANSYRHARSDAFDLWKSYSAEMTA